MLARLSDIIRILDEIAPFALAEEWDNSGLQVGSSDQVIKKILISLDPTLEAVNNASSIGAQLLVSHHPLIFRPVSCIDSSNYPGNVISEAIKKDISIVSVHTNLDYAKNGINRILAEKFELTDIEVLEQKSFQGDDDYGLGVTGLLGEQGSLASIAEKVKKVLNVDTLKVVAANEAVIERIAVVGGSGGSMIHIAAEKKVDLLITGDIGHHDALTAKSLNINVIDAGHYSTERTALKGFLIKLNEIFSKYGMDILLEMHENEMNPISIM